MLIGWRTRANVCMLEAGKIHPADVVSLDSEDLQALLSQAQA